MVIKWGILPVSEGIELVIEISKGKSETKIIAMRSFIDRNSISFLDIAKKPGADARITKPFVPDTLMLTLSLLTSIQ